MLLSPLESAESFARRMAILTAAAVAAVGNAPAERQVVTLATFQGLAARIAIAANVDMLEEQGILAAAEGGVNTAMLVGVASDGRPLASLVGAAKADWALSRIVRTQVSDAARQASYVDMATRPRVTKYVRAVRGGSCSRCLILAGRIYRSSAAFDRHPMCDCQHIPTTTGAAESLVVDPVAHIESLNEDAQNALLGQANAEAYRSGADIHQLVNAGRGTSTLNQVELFGQSMATTTEGTTKRGIAGALMREQGLVTRLTPETIRAMADSEAHFTSLLRQYGYITS